MFEDKENQTNNGNADDQTNDQIETPPIAPPNVERTKGDTASNLNKSSSNQESTEKNEEK